MQRPDLYSRVVSASERIRTPIERARRAAGQTLVALLVSVSAPSLAQSDVAQTRGLDWLQSQVGSDGSLATELSSVTTAIQARAEVLQTLIEAGRSAPPALLASLQASPSTDAEPAARKAVALRAAGADTTILQGQLIALQAGDGGVAAHA